jgi:alpha-beta hydrolase superfamily lysophospholipase
MRRVLVLVLAAMALVACAPIVQQAGRPPTGFSGPHLEADRFVSFDGARLGLNVWPAEGGEPRVVIIGLHGMNDYAGAFRTAAPYWAKRGVTTYAYDQRGYGRSPERGVWGGEELMDEDLRTMAVLVRQRHPHATLAVVGESMGSAVGITAFASDRAPDADRLVLLAPAVWGWSSQPLPQKLSAWVAGRTFRSATIEPPRFVARRIRPTDNIELWREISRDPHMLWNTRFDAIYGIIDLMDEAWKSTGRIKVPTAYFYGENDQVIPPRPSFEAAARLKPSDRTAWYPHGYHLLLIDKHANAVWDDVLAFIENPSGPLPSGAPAMPKPGTQSAKIAEKRSSSSTKTRVPTGGAASSAALD